MSDQSTLMRNALNLFAQRDYDAASQTIAELFPRLLF
jgi:hypothetical protein